MSEEKWLEDLTRLAREQQKAEKEQLDERWDALSAGQLTSAEEEEMRALGEKSEDAALAWEAFRPLEPAFQKRMAEAARFQLKGSHSAKETDQAPPIHQTPPIHQVPPIRSGGPRRLKRWGIPSALAAALALLVLWPKESPELPGYALRLDGSVRTERSERPAEQNERQLFKFGNRFQLVLTPDTTVDGEVQALAFVESQRGLDPLLDPAPKVSENGAVLFEGVVGQQVLLPIGDVSLLVAVGRPTSLPSVEALTEVLAEDESFQGEGFFAWRVPLHIED